MGFRIRWSFSAMSKALAGYCLCNNGYESNNEAPLIKSTCLNPVAHKVNATIVNEAGQRD